MTTCTVTTAAPCCPGGSVSDRERKEWCEGSEETTLSLFTDDVMTYTENPIDSD